MTEPSLPRQGLPIRVLVVDDSALVRDILTRGLTQDPQIQVVAALPSAQKAMEQIEALRPDVLTLDVEMPGMNGIAFLRWLMPRHPLPVIMVSALTVEGARTTLDALDAGALEFVAKPSANIAMGLAEMMVDLRAKVKALAFVRPRPIKAPAASPPARPAPDAAAAPRQGSRLIAIGASTGGVEAIGQVIPRFPATTPGVVIVQHMPAGFTHAFAERMNRVCAMEVKEAAEGDAVAPGRILIAPGGMQTEVRRNARGYVAHVYAGERVSGHAPSVDVLFASVAREVGRAAIGVILTGMGGDGAEGMLAMKREGARNFAQDEATCVVFGMPKVAQEKGGVELMVPLDQIAEVVLAAATGP